MSSGHSMHSAHAAHCMCSARALGLPQQEEYILTVDGDEGVAHQPRLQPAQVREVVLHVRGEHHRDLTKRNGRRRVLL